LGDRTIEVLRLSHPLQNGFDIGFGWLPLRRFSGFAFYQIFEPIKKNVWVWFDRRIWILFGSVQPFLQFCQFCLDLLAIGGKRLNLLFEFFPIARNFF
jgi:hypothetical protein